MLISAANRQGWRVVKFDGQEARVRTRRVNGRVQVTEVRVQNQHGVTQEALRTVPVRDIAATLNYEPSERALKPLALEPLKRPRASRGWTDDFYKAVGEQYGTIFLAGVRGPAQRMAEINAVPATTVHRWVREARRRGVMPAAAGKGVAG